MVNGNLLITDIDSVTDKDFVGPREVDIKEVIDSLG